MNTPTANHPFRLARWALVLVSLLLLPACSPAGSSSPTAPAEGQGLQILATTNIVGDVVQNIAGDHARVEVLLPPGSDPHSFEPTPQDVAKVARADLIFANGAGLEDGFLNQLIENTASGTPVVQVSDGIQLLEGHSETGDEHLADAHAGDPHTWTDPNNVKIWVENISLALTQADPPNQDAYQGAAADYLRQLDDLDAWITAQVEPIPPGRRVIVTDHTMFTYFANQYGFDQVGAVIPGYSTMAEPSAQELARLEDAIRRFDVRAILVGNTVNPSVAQRVAEDTGIRLVYVYTGSLSEPGGEAGTYLDYMRYNVNAIIGALQ